MAQGIKRRALRRARDKIPRTEAYQALSKAEEKGRRAIRRVILNKQ